MNAKPSVFAMLLRAAMLLAVFLLPFLLMGAIALWPESKYVKLWEAALCVCFVLGLVGYFATRARRKRQSQVPREDVDSANRGKQD